MNRRRERKVVTVLFADLVGFTARAEELDPEDVEAILRPYHERLRSELELFGGTVEKFIGDAVMALFGAPVAHEDDPERAVRAALAIRDWIAEEKELEARIAVNTGEALVDLGAHPESGEGMAAGDVVNTTARLQAAAPVNGVLVGETTYRATSQVIDYRPAEAVEAKGKAQAIRVWEAVQARSRLGVDVAHAHAVRLVGRERELAVLRDALGRALEDPSAQLVTIVGVPGIGKSRLVRELLQLVSARSDLVVWRQGRSLPYGEGVSLWSLAEMVKAQAGILDGDSSDEAAEKLVRAVDEVVSDESAWVLRHLRPLVGLAVKEEGAPVQQDERFAAWRHFFESIAERRPVVLVFEDLHWADDTLLDFVDHLAEWVRGVPMLLLGTARPELLEGRPAWGGGKLNSTTLALPPLADTEVARLVHSLFGSPVVDVAEQETIVTHSGGNPLYAEQFARMVRERRGFAELPLPENVQGIIAARLDGLGPDEKAILQDAAVLGKVFWSAALEALGREESHLGDLLHGLERKDFVERARRSSVSGSSEYAFRHALVRDVAYGQIPRADRSRKHRAVGAWFESLGRPEDHAETVAHHYTNALEFARAAGQADEELETHTRNAAVAAADRAVSLNAFAQGVRFYRQALALWPEDDPGRAHVLLRLGEALRFFDETGTQELTAAVEGLVAVGDLEDAAAAETLLADLTHLRGDRATSDKHLARASELTREVPASPAKAFVLAQLARFHMLAGRSEPALTAAADALALADRFELDSVRALALNTRGTTRAFKGDRGGIADLEESLAVAQETGAAFHIVRAYTNLGAAYGFLGDFVHSCEVNAENLRLTERLGLQGISRWQRANVASDYVQLGRWDEALDIVEAFIADVEAGTPHVQEWVCRWVRADVCLGRGDEAGALADLELGVPLARANADPANLADALSMYARFLLDVGRIGEAADLFDEVLEFGREHEGAGLGSFETATVARRLGRARETIDLIDEFLPPERKTPPVQAALLFLEGDFAGAANRYGEMQLLFLEALACLIGGEALVDEGRHEEGDALLRRALPFFKSVSATRYIRRCEVLLAASA